VRFGDELITAPPVSRTSQQAMRRPGGREPLRPRGLDTVQPESVGGDLIDAQGTVARSGEAIRNASLDSSRALCSW
jgi:hypothetical protein